MGPVLDVLRPGLLATLQDLGRTGYQRFGMVVSGAMDPFALQAANCLVGNPRGAAVLETCAQGPLLEATHEAVIAIGGPCPGALLNGRPLEPWRTHRLQAGDRLDLSGPLPNAWTYLAVAGGFVVPAVLGSRSTYLRAGLGGVEGRALAYPDVLWAGTARPDAVAGRRLTPSVLPAYGREVEVRVVTGPQAEWFTAAARAALEAGPYEVTHQSDRMGYRLRGAPLPRHDARELLSEAVAMGSVQVLPDAQPLVLMADRQTTGGYPKIAGVVSADLPLLAQLRPAGRVRFRTVTIEEAEEAAAEREELLAALELGGALGRR